MRGFRDLVKGKRKGFIDTGMMLIISIIVLSLFFVFLISYLQPIKKYIDLNQIARKYSLIMEKEGYLSPSNFIKLQDEMVNIGFKLPDISITATSTRVDFGEEVSINIKYNFRKIEKKVNGLSVTNEVKIIPMEVEKSTTCKNGG